MLKYKGYKPQVILSLFCYFIFVVMITLLVLVVITTFAPKLLEISALWLLITVLIPILLTLKDWRDWKKNIDSNRFFFPKSERFLICKNGEFEHTQIELEKFEGRYTVYFHNSRTVKIFVDGYVLKIDLRKREITMVEALADFFTEEQKMLFVQKTDEIIEKHFLDNAERLRIREKEELENQISKINKIIAG